MVASPPRAELLCYASGRYLVWRHLLIQSARRFGHFAKIHACSRSSVSAEYRARHAAIFQVSRGDGLWLWKPHLIQRRLSEMREGDILFYMDAGARFCADPAPLLDLALREPSGVVGFRLEHLERRYTKGHVFTKLDMESPVYRDTVQTLGSYLLLRVSPEARAFVDEWQRWCEDPDLLLDEPVGDCAADFIAHRHDQSLFSLLLKKKGITPHPDPSQYGQKDRHSSGQTQIIDHHRGFTAPRRYRILARLVHYGLRLLQPLPLARKGVSGN